MLALKVVLSTGVKRQPDSPRSEEEPAFASAPNGCSSTIGWRSHATETSTATFTPACCAVPFRSGDGVDQMNGSHVVSGASRAGAEPQSSPERLRRRARSLSPMITRVIPHASTTPKTIESSGSTAQLLRSIRQVPDASQYGDLIKRCVRTVAISRVRSRSCLWKFPFWPEVYRLPWRPRRLPNAAAALRAVRETS